MARDRQASELLLPFGTLPQAESQTTEASAR
jgi:hypothetical protein